MTTTLTTKRGLLSEVLVAEAAEDEADRAHRNAALLGIVVIAGMTLFFPRTGWTDVPAPPVNQTIGMFDGLIGEMQEADCRVCHDSGVPDRHHLLDGQPIPPGSLVPYPDADGDGNPDTL